QAYDILAGWRFYSRFEPRLRALAQIWRILSVNHTSRGNRAGHQFRAVPATRAHIQHLHAGTSASEGQQLDRVAPLVDLQVRIGPVGRSNYCGVIGYAVLRQRSGHRYASRNYGGKGHKVKGFSNCSLSGHIVLPRPISREVGSRQVAPFWIATTPGPAQFFPQQIELNL